MKFSLIFLIARTQMVSKLRQTIIAALGVTFGISMFIIMISFMTGVNNLLNDTMLTASPHIHIYNEIENKRTSVVEEYLPNSKHIVHHQKPKVTQINLHNGFNIVDVIRRDTQVYGVSPFLNSQVFYNYGPHQISGVIAGVDIMAENKLFDLKAKMIQGKIENLLTSNNGIILGAGVAEKMNIYVGDNVTVTTPKGNSLLLSVQGVYKTGVAAIDNVKSYANLSIVQKILGKDKNYITDINLKLNDITKAKDLAPKYMLQFGYKAEDWETVNATILISFFFRNILTYVVVITLLVVAGFGIYNIMNMTIYEKIREIAILKAMGFTGRDIVGIFMTQAATIGTGGGILGILIGFILSYMLSLVPFDGGQFLSVDHFPVNFEIKYYLYGLFFGIATTCLAGFIPSRKASKVDPVQIIRGQ